MLGQACSGKLQLQSYHTQDVRSLMQVWSVRRWVHSCTGGQQTIQNFRHGIEWHLALTKADSMSSPKAVRYTRTLCLLQNGLQVAARMYSGSRNAQRLPAYYV